MKKANHRILFQNAEGSINAGVWMNDPDMDLDEYTWYNCLADQIMSSIEKDEKMIVIDEILRCQSCYVELHR